MTYAAKILSKIGAIVESHLTARNGAVLGTFWQKGDGCEALLRPGMTVGVVQDAGALTPDDKLNIRAFLAKHGLGCVMSDLVPHYNLASTHENMAKDILTLAERPDVDLLWSATGKGGEAAIVPHLQRLIRDKNYTPRPGLVGLMGYSHQTYHSLYQGLGITTHPLSVTQLAYLATPGLLPEEVVTAQMHALQHSDGMIAPITAANKAAKQVTNLDGVVIGGNSGVIICEMAERDPTLLSWKEKLILVEYLPGWPHQWAREFKAILQKAAKEGARGVLLGARLVVDPNDRAEMERQTQRVATESSIPVFTGPFPSHSRVNPVFPLGKQIAVCLDPIFANIETGAKHLVIAGFKEDMTLQRLGLMVNNVVPFPSPKPQDTRAQSTMDIEDARTINRA